MERIENEEDFLDYRNKYTEEDFWDKVRRVAVKAGTKVVYSSLLLYYTLVDNKVKPTDKLIILGALGYFIFPIDLIPDFIPFLGYTDDLAALIYALKKIYDCVTLEIEEKAKAKTRDLFGDVNEADFDLF